MELNLEKQKKAPLTIESIPTNEKWRKHFLDTEFATKIQKYLVLILSEKSSEGVKNAMDALENEFLAKNADVRDHEKLISIFGIVTKYLGELFFKSEEAVEKIHVLRRLIDVAIEISKHIKMDPYRAFDWSAVKKVNNHVPFLTLFSTFGDNIEFLRLVSSFYVLRPRRRAQTDDDGLILRAIVNTLPLVDNTTQGCLVAAGSHILNSGFSFSGEQFDDAAIQFLSQPDPSFAKFMIALLVPAKQTRKIGKKKVETDYTTSFVSVLAGYVKWCDEYEAALKESTMDKVLNLPRKIVSYVKELKGHEKSFFDQSLDNLRHLRSSNATHCAVEMLLLFVIEAPLVPGTKIIDLPDLTKNFFEALTTMDHIWNDQLISDVLAKYNLPSTRETMQLYIADINNDGPIRFPVFETIDSVPWATLSHAYGTAENTPKYLRQLGSWVPSTREAALVTMRNGITHQGQCYETTPHIVPFLLELVEATLVQDKGKILEFCTNLLTDRMPYFLMDIDGLDLEMVWSPYPDVLQIRLDIESKFTQNLQRIFKLLSNESSEVRGWAAYLLGLLPKSALESVPKLQERYEIETDSKVKASLLVAISLMYFPKFYNHDDNGDVDITNCANLPFITLVRQLYETTRGTDAIDLEFAAFACLVRLDQLDPKSVKRDLRRFLMEPDEISDKRANYVIPNMKEFLLHVVYCCTFSDLLPYVIQQLDSSDYYTGQKACEVMFHLAFRNIIRLNRSGRNLPHLHFEISSQEQILVVTKAVEFLERNHISLWDLQEYGLPYDKEECQDYLVEARVIEDLYGDSDFSDKRVAS